MCYDIMERMYNMPLDQYCTASDDYSMYKKAIGLLSEEDLLEMLL